MSDTEVQYTADEKSQVEPGCSAVEDAEYSEYLALDHEFRGEKLKKLTRKIDWHVLPQLIFIYLLSYVDRTNVGNAKLFGAIADLHMTNQDWNTGLTVFFITYALGGPPANLLLQRYGPRKVLSSILFLVSVVLAGSGCASNKGTWYALRMLLGLFEAGMFPGCVFTLTTWYTPSQIHGRVNIYYCGASLAGAFSSLLAYGIGQLDHTWGYRGWRFIYVIEGVFSAIIAVAAYFVLQETPAKQDKWLDDEERRFLVLRGKFAYGGARSGGSLGYNVHDCIEAFKSVHVWVLSFAFFSVGVAVYGLSFTLPTIVANMGFTAANAQGLSAPPYIFACLCVLLCGWFSDRYKLRMLSIVIPSVVAFIGLLVAVLTVQNKKLIPLTYIGVSLAAGGTYCLSPGIAVWISLNCSGATKRAAGIAITVVWVQLGGLVGSNIYLAKEAPKYPTGFGCSLAFLGVGNIVVPLLYWVYIGRVNAKRATISEDEVRQRYSLDEIERMGDRSALYRYER